MSILLNTCIDADGKISESKVNHLVDLYMENAKAGKEAGKNDPFWYKTEKEFMLAMIYYVLENDNIPEEEKNLKTVLKKVQMGTEYHKLADAFSPLQKELYDWFVEKGIMKYNDNISRIDVFKYQRIEADNSCMTKWHYDTVLFAPERTINSVLQTTAVDLENFIISENLANSDTVIRLSDIESETEFLWNPYLPIGELTVMYASEGSGKTFAAVGIASDITAGRSLPSPDCYQQPVSKPEKVLLISTDDNAGVILPRLKKAGGNPDNCFVLKTPQSVEDLRDGFLLPESIDDTVRIVAFKELLEKIQPKLVIIDDWSAYISNNRNLSTNAENILEVANILTVLAKEFHCAMLIITNDTAPGCKTLIRSAHSALCICNNCEICDNYEIVPTRLNYQMISETDAVCYQITNQGKNKVARFEWKGFVS